MLMHSSQVAGPKLLRALGLPTEGCLNLTISFKPNHVVTAQVEYAVNQEALQALQDLAPQMALEVKATTFEAHRGTQPHT